MLQLWKNIIKSLVSFYGKPSTTKAANGTQKQPMSINLFLSDKKLPEWSYHSSQKSARSFSWNLPSAKSIFLEICGLSSAVALGWEFGQYKKTNKLRPHKDSSTLCQPVICLSFPKKSFSTFSRHVRLNINTQPPDLLSANHSDEVKHWCLNTPEKHNLNGEINKTLIGMVQTLERGGLLGLSSLQNCVGIELAREQGDLKDQEFMAIPEYSQTSVYQKEAFKCFKASMELGSREGAYNMGICYEQGIGTSVNLDKAAACYEEAALKNHPGAKYNLGLLYYQRYIGQEKRDERDLHAAFTLLHQAAQNGVQQAWSAILVLFDREVAQEATPTFSNVSLFGLNSTNQCNSRPESKFRKAISEPRGLSYFDDQESVYNSETSDDSQEQILSVKKVVSFYLDDSKL